MSKISVLTPLGQWSEPIVGLDKIHLLKEAIQCEFGVLYADWKEREGRKDACIDYDEVKLVDDEELLRKAENHPELFMPLCELEINTKEITKRSMNDNPTENPRVDWKYFKTASGIELSKAKLLKMRLETLQKMADKATYLSPIYKELIAAAEVPSPTPVNYCLTLKFENE